MVLVEPHSGQREFQRTQEAREVDLQKRLTIIFEDSGPLPSDADWAIADPSHRRQNQSPLIASRFPLANCLSNPSLSSRIRSNDFKHGTRNHHSSNLRFAIPAAWNVTYHLAHRMGKSNGA
jgi:hypothetical protein